PEQKRSILKLLQKAQKTRVVVIDGDPSDGTFQAISSDARGTAITIQILNEYQRQIQSAMLIGELESLGEKYTLATQIRVNWNIINNTLELYRTAIEETLNTQIVQPLLAYNMPEEEARITIIRQLTKVPIPEEPDVEDETGDEVTEQ
ncbi:MAG: hypothetical protein ACK47M_18325, partial [Caldilinea sp.]